jgi:hypothetical protein
MRSEWILGRLIGGVKWIQLAESMDWWRAVVNTVMNLRVLTPRNYITAYGLEQWSSTFFELRVIF